jgi:hypothetical protein
MPSHRKKTLLRRGGGRTLQVEAAHTAEHAPAKAVDDERNDVAKIAMFDVERCNEKRGTEACQYRQRDKGGEQRNLPARREAILPRHQSEQDRKVDRKIDERDDGGGGRDEVRTQRSAPAGNNNGPAEHALLSRRISRTGS